MADDMRGSVGGQNGPQCGRALQISPLNQSMLDQCIKNILSDHEKANDLIHEHMRNVLKEQMNALRKQHEDIRKCTDELQKQLADRDSLLQTTSSQLQTANAQLRTNTLEMETLKTRIADLQRTNTDLLTKNKELEEFQSDFDQLFKRKKRSVQPTEATVALEVEDSSKAAAVDVQNPVAHDSTAATQRLAENSVPVMTEVSVPAPMTEHSCSSQSSVDNMSPELPALAALLPESPLPTPVDISFDSSTSDQVVEPKTPAVSEPNSTEIEMATVSHNLASEASSEMTHPESPELARPKKKVTFSPHAPEVHIIQPVPVAAGKRKRPEPLPTAPVCKVCLVEYDSQAELRGHSCPLRTYECSSVGCGKTFQTPSAQRRHEKIHTEKEEPTSSRKPGSSRFH